MPKGFNETLVSPEDGKEYLVVPSDGGADFDACGKQVRDDGYFSRTRCMLESECTFVVR